VLRLSTGKELVRVPLAATLPTIGTVFLGLNEDVYILSSEAGSDKGLLSRIFVQSEFSNSPLIVKQPERK
jgi:hypothetical protein